jgi:hypothetical protein
VVQPDAHLGGKLRRQRCDGVLEDAHAVAAPVGFFFQQPGAFQRALLQRQLRGRAQLRLELGEAWKGALEQLAHAVAPARRVRRALAHRAQRGIDHRSDEGAAGAEIAIGGGTRHRRAHRNLGHRRDVALVLDQLHRRGQQQMERGCLDAARRRRRGFGDFEPGSRHAGISGCNQSGDLLVSRV